MVVHSDSMHKRFKRRTDPRSRSHKQVDPFYRSKAWHRLRAIVLKRDHGICADCGQPGTHVDHIVPRSVAPELALDESNMVVLCHSCHSRKTVRHDGGFGRAVSQEERIADAGCDVAGVPLAPGHPWYQGE